MFRILIAEDDPSTARLLTAILKREGFESLTAADGVQALEMLDHNHVDLLLCDMMMPRMDGFALTKAIRDSVLVTQQKWRDKPLTFDADIAPCRYNGSEALLKEIWLNLLDNAAKFSAEDGAIGVTLRKEQGNVVVSVTDQGCGMDEETRRHIFEQFYQGDTSHKTQGNGLGLAMAQKIAALHGGSIAADSRPGAGSCFTVRLAP